MTMANPTATLYATMYFDTDNGFGSEVETSITYTSNGHDFEVTKIDAPYCPDEQWDLLEDDVQNYVADIFREGYAEWLDGRGEYLCDQAEDRRAA